MAEREHDGFRIARPVRLGHEVYDVILRRLMALEIEPGERITVDSLARQLDVSQTPVREALHRLEAIGLVVKVHLSGYRAAPQMTERQFRDLFEMRLLFEPPLAAKAARLMSPEQRLAIKVLASDAGETASDDEQTAYNLFAEADANFHLAIAKGGKNDLLHKILEREAVQLRLFRLRLRPQAIHAAVKEHAVIAAALVAGNPDQAEQAMRVHIESAEARFADVYLGAYSGNG